MKIEILKVPKEVIFKPKGCVCEAMRVTKGCADSFAMWLGHDLVQVEDDVLFIQNKDRSISRAHLKNWVVKYPGESCYGILCCLGREFKPVGKGDK
jgi:hypothetical protein